MNILVYGWYHHNNVGDDLFMDAFRALFPNFNFSFVNQITPYNLQGIDAVFIGGGSLLGEVICVSDDVAWELLKQQRIFYIGIGAETAINVFHAELMAKAELIAIRSSVGLDRVMDINPNTIVINDLVHYLQPTKAIETISKSVLILPNISVVPTWNEPHWKHAAWDYFKTEFAQFLDHLVNEGYSLGFLPLCTDFALDDNMAAAEIVSRMVYRDHGYFLPKENTLTSITETISRYNVIITQRYHGMVLAEMVKVPNLSIVHHNKLKRTQGLELSFYGITKDKIKEQFDQLIHAKVTQFLPIDRDMFTQLQRSVEHALRGHQK
jgi:polysaccharide pyruvyl transferase WcaK-like protein